MAEYKLSYTGQEINEKLEKVDSLVSTVNGISPDVNGNVELEIGSGSGSGGSEGIIDVIALPTENINENAFYRLTSAKFVSNFYTPVDNWTCYYVNELPEIGEPVSTDMVNIVAYYNTQDNEVYGYADSTISAVGGIPVGWYPIGVLAQAFNVDWGGVITDVSETDDTAKVLLSKDYYLYQDGWCKVPFAYEKAPEFDITWDGDMTGRPALDMSMLGFANGLYFVKVSDLVPTIDEVIGSQYKVLEYDGDAYNSGFIGEGDINTTAYPGAFTINDYIVIVHSQDDLATALGIPTGIYTNGVYFWTYTDTSQYDSGYISRFTAPSKVTKIDGKYVDGLSNVAHTGNYIDLINKPVIYEDAIRYNATQSLNSTQKQRARNNIDVYSKSEVDNKIANSSSNVDLTEVQNMIDNAIGTAIGGSY